MNQFSTADLNPKIEILNFINGVNMLNTSLPLEGFMLPFQRRLQII